MLSKTHCLVRPKGLGKLIYIYVGYRFAALEDLDTEMEINSAW
jgi:hypothetical protein